MLRLLNRVKKIPASVLGGENRLQILIYHRVLKEPDPLLPGEIDAYSFDWQMKLVSEYFNVLPLPVAVHLLKCKELPPASLCVTFDDGYLDNKEIALPILKKYDIHATFFIATGYLNGGIMWNDVIREAVRGATQEFLDLEGIGLSLHPINSDREKISCIKFLTENIKYLSHDKKQNIINHICDLTKPEIPNNLMMTDEDVRELSRNGMEIGAHTVNHPILTTLNHDQAVIEIEGGKRELEEITGNEVSFFAYPNGKLDQDYDSRHVAILEEIGFDAAVSTNWGVNCPKTNMYELFRFTPWDKSNIRFYIRLMGNYAKYN